MKLQRRGNFAPAWTEDQELAFCSESLAEQNILKITEIKIFAYIYLLY